MSLENSDKEKDIKGQIQESVRNPTGDPRMPIRHDTDDFTNSVHNSIDAWYWSNGSDRDPRVPVHHDANDFADSARKSVDAWHWTNN